MFHHHHHHQKLFAVRRLQYFGRDEVVPDHSGDTGLVRFQALLALPYDLTDLQEMTRLYCQPLRLRQL